MNEFIAIITGDIINSKEVNAKYWLPKIRSVLETYGQEPINWQIYRGDSFQIEASPIDALKICLEIKSVIKQLDPLDARIAIGIGNKTYQAKKIMECNGSAFVNSGECFEALNKKTLAIKTPWKSFDKKFNLIFNLTTLTIDNWTPTSCEIIQMIFENPGINQTELAKKLKKSQSAVSESLKRSGFYEIEELLFYYTEKISNKCLSSS